MATRHESDRPLIPTRDLARHAERLLRHMDAGRGRFVLLDREANYEIELGEEVYTLLRHILIDLSQNRAVQVLPLDLELTTVQAAEFLQVSRPFLIKRIESGEIPCRMVGTHRRLALKDLIAYRETQMRRGREAREQMTREAEKLGWGY